MSIVRALLDCLNRDQLVRLLDARGWAAGSDNESRRQALARSYRGDVARFVVDLRRNELVDIFANPEIGALRLVWRRSPAYLNEPELRRIAIELFVEGREPGGAVTVEGLDRFHGRDEDEDESTYGEGALTDEEVAEWLAEVFADVGETWTRPRKLSTVMRRLHFPDVERLRTDRFQQLLGVLAIGGIELAVDGEIADEASRSPGIDALVTLRLAPDEDTDDEADEEGYEDEQEDEDDGDEEDTDDRTEYVAFADVGETWTRPRGFAGICRGLGMDAPRRLRTDRFQQIVAELLARGVQLQLPDGSIAEPVSTSPGARARVRLRRAATAVEAGSAPVRVDPPRATPRHTTPAAAMRPSEIEIIRRGSEIGFTSSRRGPLPPFELALLRLQFLTAAPSIERESDPAWPAGFLAIAQAGIGLSPSEAHKLALVAPGYLRGAHDPLGVARQLAPHLDDAAWDALFREFERLNASQSVYVTQMRQDVLTDLGIGIRSAVTVPSEPGPADNRSVNDPIAARAPKAVVTPVTPRPGERSLGVLSNMFDDL